MIKIENTHVDNIVRAVYSARNAMNSWDKSDSDWDTDSLGENDLKLAKSLSKAGSDHRKFLRMINVTMDIIAPLYWWKEFDTYKVGTVANSCSTMHKIHAKEFEMNDFSHEHLDEIGHACLDMTVNLLNSYRTRFNENHDKNHWWQMIQLLPTSYNQMRTVQVNYETLLNIYNSRAGHKLDEWQTLREFIETLPYFKMICIDEPKEHTCNCGGTCGGNCKCGGHHEE